MRSDRWEFYGAMGREWDSLHLPRQENIGADVTVRNE